MDEEGKLYVAETFVNRTEGYIFGEGDPHETWADHDEVGQLFRDMQREYGRCESRIYVDATAGPKAVGWVFAKTMEYEDTHEKYVREVWVTVYDAPPVRGREWVGGQVHDFGRVSP